MKFLPFTAESGHSVTKTEGETGVNKIILIGNLGRDPELNVTGDGTPVTKFSLAVTRRFKSGGENKEITTWFNIVAWRNLAEICERYLKKGSKVYVEGRIESRRYTDREGVNRETWEVTLIEMEMLTPKSSGDNGNGREKVTAGAESSNPFLPDYPDDVS